MVAVPVQSGVSAAAVGLGCDCCRLSVMANRDNLYLDRDPASPRFRHSLRDANRCTDSPLCRLAPPQPALTLLLIRRPGSFPLWCSARGTRVVVQPGDLLYIPPFTIHATETLSDVSLTANRFAPWPKFEEHDQFARGCRP